MRPQIAQILYSEVIFLPPLSPNLWSNANDKRAHSMCALPAQDVRKSPS
jgi:hypothetical protein